jgi:hypothetical protein
MRTAEEMESDPTQDAGNGLEHTGLAEAAELWTKKAAAKTLEPEKPGANADPVKPSEQQPGPNGTQVSGQPVGGLGKPSPIKPEFATIPTELTSLPNWVLWRYLPPKSPGQKWRKVPYQTNGKTADTTDRATWNTFEECCAAYLRGGFDGIGFAFDGEIGADGLCYCGVDLDACIEDGKQLHSLARSRIKRLNTYTECSVSGTGIHCITRAKPLERIVKFDGVEIYTTARFFTFTGRSFGQIKSAPAEICALVEEVRAKEAAVKQQQSGLLQANRLVLFNGAKPATAFAELDAQESLADGIKNAPWFTTLSPELKNEVVDHALGVIANNTRLLELEANEGNNSEYYKLTTAVARSGAPNAEDIFVKHASTAKNADPDEALRQHFSRCCESHRTGSPEITVGTLLFLATQNGANFDQWKGLVPTEPALPPVNWSAADLQVSFSNIPHRKWLYGVDLVRGEITILGSSGGVGKSSLAIGMAVATATGRELLGEKVHGGDDLKVLLINGEDTGTEIMRRIWAFCLSHNVAEETLNRLYVAGVDDTQVQRLSFLRTTDKNFSMLDRSGFEALEAAFLELRPDLIVLDPLVAFCGSGNMNDTVMSQVMRELKSIAAKFNCAVLVVHHNRKGGEPGSAEAVSGAAAIGNLARRVIMPVTMTEDEAEKLKVWPSQRHAYFKVVNAKSNLAPRSDDTPWYRLNNETLPNAEPPTYERGDGVQAVERIQLPLLNNDVAAADGQIIRRAILGLVENGKLIGGQVYPYSPNVTGATNERTLLNDAMDAVKKATGRPWHEGDLKAAVKGTISSLVAKKCLVEGEKIKGPRFRRGNTLRVDWSRTGWSKDGATAVPHEEKGPDGATAAAKD